MTKPVYLDDEDPEGRVSSHRLHNGVKTTEDKKCCNETKITEDKKCCNETKTTEVKKCCNEAKTTEDKNCCNETKTTEDKTCCNETKTTEDKKCCNETKTTEDKKCCNETKTTEDKKCCNEAKTTEDKKCCNETKTTEDKKCCNEAKTTEDKKCCNETKTNEDKTCCNEAKTIEDNKCCNESKTMEDKKCCNEAKTTEDKKCCNEAKSTEDKKCCNEAKTTEETEDTTSMVEEVYVVIQPYENDKTETKNLKFSDVEVVCETKPSVQEPFENMETTGSRNTISLFLKALFLTSATMLNALSILPYLYKNGGFAAYVRKKRKYAMSEYIQENIRFYVHRFFKEMCNMKFRSVSIKQLLKHIQFPNLKFPSVLTVYPAHTLGEYCREIESNPQMTFQERMQYDMLRTSTFSKFPRNSPVSSLALAKAGFYYEGEADEVICFKCGKKYRNWKHLDDPVQIHREISPTCPFISNLESGNPLRSAASARAGSDVLYRREDERRNDTLRTDTVNGSAISCNQIPSHASIACNSMGSDHDTSSFQNEGENNVASASESKVRAANLNHNTSSVASSQSSVDRSGRNSSTDALAQNSSPMHENASGNINIPTCRSNNVTTQNLTSSQNIAASSTNTSTASSTATINDQPRSAASTLEPLGISIEKPKYPQYAVLATRISSFSQWPEHLRQKPEELARAGFLYEGTNDFTRCFFCAGGLRDWEPEDNPWIEHARWYKNCVFVRQCKGEEFINLVQEGKIQEAMGKLEGRRVHEREQIEDIMKSTAALSVQEMGYSVELVKKAIVSLTKNKDTHPLTADSLLQCVWEMEEEVDTDLNGQNDNQTTNEQNQNTERSSPSGQTSDNAAESTEALIAENRQLKEQQICKICMDEDISIVFLPCGHMATCVNCAPAIKKCPLCRRFIKGTVKAILS